MLKVLGYSSFVSVYGPGRIIKKKFESFCDCQLLWFLTEDSRALNQHFRLIPDIDMVIGWDQLTLRSADTAQWEDLSHLKRQLVREKFLNTHLNSSPYFLPFDWSPIGFIYYRDDDKSVKSLKLLPQLKGRISFPEPRSSSLGLQFYYWIYEVMEGDKRQIADFLKRLKEKVYGPVFSWSLAYGLFQKGKTDMGLSYLSSLIYHESENFMEGKNIGGKKHWREQQKASTKTYGEEEARKLVFKKEAKGGQQASRKETYGEESQEKHSEKHSSQKHSEKNRRQRFFFAQFQEGHPLQMEFISIAKTSKNKQTALQLAEFLLSQEIQAVILNQHYMFPVSKATTEEKWPKPPLLPATRINEFMEDKKALLKLWEAIMH